MTEVRDLTTDPGEPREADADICSARPKHSRGAGARRVVAAPPPLESDFPIDRSVRRWLNLR
jgi:hypothetical protein